MARKYKILEQSNADLTKQKQEAKMNAEILASDGFSDIQLTPPTDLTDHAKTEWKRIIKDIRKLPVRNLDRATLELYCEWYGMYKDLKKKIKNSKPEDRLQYTSELQKITKNITSLTSDLGMTVNSRMQMMMPKDEDNQNKPMSLESKFG